MSEGPVKHISQYARIEKEILNDWAELLGVERIGMDDKFFDLCGDSMAAMVCISRMKSKFAVEFPPDTFFSRATISDFARAIDKLSSDAATGSCPT